MRYGTPCGRLPKGHPERSMMVNHTAPSLSTRLRDSGVVLHRDRRGGQDYAPASSVGPSADAYGRGTGFCPRLGASTKRRWSRARLARPNICRLSSFKRVICPSTGPLLQGTVSPALTAS
jgi:hypothetical protein